METTHRLTIVHGGPGTGKTQRLVEAVAVLSPEERRRAVVLTLNAPAVAELRGRLCNTVQSPVPACWPIDRLAREVMRALGREEQPAMRQKEIEAFISWLLEGIADGEAPARLKVWARFARSIAPDLSAAFGLLRRYSAAPDEFTAFAADRDHLAALACVYKRYVDQLNITGISDSDGRNALALDALGGAAAGLPNLVFIDEAQELDALQVAIVKALAGSSGRVFACVDNLQRTRMYRGAEPDVVGALSAAMNADPYLESLAGAAETPLSRLVKNWEFAQGCTIVSTMPRFIVAGDPEAEADAIAAIVTEAGGRAAVLTRSSRGAGLMRAALRARGVAVTSEAGDLALVPRFIRDALTILQDAPDEEQRVERNRAALRMMKTTGVDSSFIDTAHGRERAGRDTSATLAQPVSGWLTSVQAGQRLTKRLHDLALASGWLRGLPESLRDGAICAYGSALETLHRLEDAWTATGHAGHLPIAMALRDLERIVNATDEGPPAAKEGTAVVDVLKVHASAGRHWDTVIVSGLQEGVFPQFPTASPFFPASVAEELRAWLSGRCGREVAMGRFERRETSTVEEEQRLFLTAVTRSRGSVWLSCHLVEGEDLTAPSWFLRALLPHETLSAPESAEVKWKCVLARYLPTRDEGRETCEGCSVAVCMGRSHGAVEPAVVLEQKQPGPVTPRIPGEPAIAPDFRLSASSLNEWFRCPRRWFFSKALKLMDEEADTLSTGSLVHEILSRFNKSRPRTWDTLNAAMAAVFATTGAQFTVVGPEAVTSAENAERGYTFSSKAAWLVAKVRIEAALRQFWERSAAGADYETHWVENWIPDFLMPDSAGAEHRFAGIVDLAINGPDGITIVDFKTGKPESSPAQLRKKWPHIEAGSVRPADDSDVQMTLYAAAAEALGLKPVELVHEYVTVSKPSQGKRLLVPIFSRKDQPDEGDKNVLFREDLDEYRHFFGDTAREIKATDIFRAVPSSGECAAFGRPCPFQGICDVEEAVE